MSPTPNWLDEPINQLRYGQHPAGALIRRAEDRGDIVTEYRPRTTFRGHMLAVLVGAGFALLAVWGLGL